MVEAKLLYLQKRRQQMLERIQSAGQLSVAELSREFGVSEVTIRNDLQALADENLVVRTHGGAVPVEEGMSQIALALRLRQQIQEKSRIGQAGAAMIADGDAIILDSSTTALAITPYIKHCRHLTVITNAVSVAQTLLDAPSVTVVMAGGRLRRDTASLVGTDGLEMLRKFNVQKGFFGAHGLTLENGLTDVSAEEAEVKRALAQMCRRVIAVVDATKWGRVGLASFASLDDIDTIISDVDAPEDPVAEMHRAGKSIILV
jgi:DeoR/GlpR family transcriptional regulator of sugar metabolism